MANDQTRIRKAGAKRGEKPGEGATAMRLKNPAGKLTAMNGPAAGKIFMLDYTRVTVGRGPNNVIRLDDDYTISEHENAIFETKGGKVVLIDGGGTNVVLLNGQEAPGEHALKFGDLIVIGETTLRLDPP